MHRWLQLFKTTSLIWNKLNENKGTNVSPRWKSIKERKDINININSSLGSMSKLMMQRVVNSNLLPSSFPTLLSGNGSTDQLASISTEQIEIQPTRQNSNVSTGSLGWTINVDSKFPSTQAVDDTFLML